MRRNRSDVSQSGMEHDVLLQFNQISKTFPGVKALDGVSFSVRRGEVHVLLGENGAGKSTIIKILTGVHQADGGSIVFNGQEISPNGIMDSRALGIGTVFQENSLVPHLNVAENIFLTREKRNRAGLIDWKQTYAECRKWLSELGLELDPRRRVSEYSVAQQQIIEIVKVFSQNPSLVILDEPTSALSDHEIDNLFRIVRMMQARGITFIFISHRMAEIKQIGNGGTVLRDGKCVASFADVTQIEIDEIIRQMVGRSLSEQFPERHAAVGEVVFEAEGLTVPKTIFDVSLCVRRGEVVGLAGLVGAGRTSTAKAIIGALHRTAGVLKMDGKPIQIRSPQDAIRHRIGYLPEDRKAEGLLLEKTVLENVTISSMAKYKKLLFLQKKKQAEDVQAFVDKLRIKTPGIGREVKFLSGGNQQKVVFSKWLCAESRLYIFDEPTRGIDVGAKSEMYRIINELAEQGAAILVISSELPEIIGICDRVVVMHEGRVSGELPREEATQENIMLYAIGGPHVSQ